MAQPGYSTTPTTTTTTAGSAKYNHYTAGAQSLDCLRLLLLIIALALIPCVSFALYFIQPSSPQFRVESSSLSVLNVSADSDVTAHWDVTFSVKNPNKDVMFFEDIKASVFHEKEGLLNTTLKPFEVGAKNQTTIKTRFASVLVHVDGCNVNNTALNGSCGAADLSVELQVKAKYAGWTWPIKRDVIKVECGSNSTTPVFGSRECGVRGGRWESIRNTSFTVLGLALIFLFILAVSL